MGRKGPVNSECGTWNNKLIVWWANRNIRVANRNTSHAMVSGWGLRYMTGCMSYLRPGETSSLSQTWFVERINFEIGTLMGATFATIKFDSN